MFSAHITTTYITNVCAVVYEREPSDEPFAGATPSTTPRGNTCPTQTAQALALFIIFTTKAFTFPPGHLGRPEPARPTDASGAHFQQ
eukprot:5339772-Pyramimonas_sp.AAC.1